jgi:hypothetical protein
MHDFKKLNEYSTIILYDILDDNDYEFWIDILIYINNCYLTMIYKGLVIF